MATKASMTIISGSTMQKHNLFDKVDTIIQQNEELLKQNEDFKKENEEFRKENDEIKQKLKIRSTPQVVAEQPIGKVTLWTKIKALFKG